MSAEPGAKIPSTPGARANRIECSVDTDSRLLASFGALLSHAAQRADLPAELHQALAATGADLAQQAASRSSGTGPSTAHLVVEEFTDRLELTFDATARETCERLKNQAGERIRCEARDGHVRVTLLKPCGIAKSSSTY